MGKLSRAKGNRNSSTLSRDETLRRLAGIIVMGMRQSNKSDRMIREEVVKAASKAFIDPAESMSKMMTIEGKRAPLEMINLAGMIRLSLDAQGIDRHDMRAQENFMTEIKKAVEDALAGR